MDSSFDIASFGPAVPDNVVKLVNATKLEFTSVKRQVFPGPIRDNKGLERVKAGEAFPLTELRKLDWLVEGVIGQPR